MRNSIIAGSFAIALAGLTSLPAAATPVSASGVAGALPAATGERLVQHVANRVVVRKTKRVYVRRGPKSVTVVRRPARVVVVRPWRHRPYYGRIVAGIAIGTVIGVAIANTVPVAPGPDLCWYWANPARTSGYWDYCY